MSRVAISIESLTVRVYLGVNASEQLKRRAIPIDLRFEYEWPEHDELSVAIDYRGIRDAIIEAVQNGRFKLVESLAHTVLGIVKKDHRVLRATATVRKPRALRLSKCVVVTAEWCRNLQV